VQRLAVELRREALLGLVEQRRHEALQQRRVLPGAADVLAHEVNGCRHAHLSRGGKAPDRRWGHHIPGPRAVAERRPRPGERAGPTGPPRPADYTRARWLTSWRPSSSLSTS